jgi:hypothetical protein
LTATPSASSAAAGSQFTVDLAMNTASGFVGWGGEVDFDANKLQCTGVTAGTWLSNYVTTNGGNNFSQTPAIDNTKGIVNNISYGGINLSSSATGLTGQGVLCTLSFTVKTGATGTTTIQPVAIVLDDPAANQINNTAINGGTVTLTGGTQSAPTITSFTPITAGAGTSVTIAGTNLSNASAVSFGGIAATSYTVSSATQIIAVVGTGTTGSVSVTTPGGTATLAGFTFTSGGAPTITSFTPTTSGSSSTVVITGTNLTGATAVSFGGTAAASYAVNSATQIIAVVGTGTTGSVSVTTPGGTATLNGFTYSTTAPIITSFTPQACASGDTITITGTHLANATSVKTGTLANGTIGSAASITSNTDTQIVATVQASVTGYLSVTTSNGTANVSGFTYTGPVITSFTPTSGDIGTTVTITGTGLENVNSVQFGGASGPAGTITNKTSTQITVTVGNGASGTVYVSAAGGGTNYKDGFTFVPSGAGISFTAVPSATSVAAGQTFTIALNVADTTKAFLAWSADVNFDPNILTFNLSASTQGSFLENYATSHSGSVYSGTPTIDNTNGHVTGLNDSALGVNTGLIGSGTLYTMNFTVKAGATGSTTITLANVTLVDDHGSPGPYNILPATVTGCTLTIGGQGITSFTPTTATAGMSVTITGNGFLNASAVSFGGTAAASYTVSSATQIIAVVGTGTTGSVSVTTSSGTVFTLAGFTYTVPAITSFTPTSAGAGASVTITGIGFTSATAVKFGGTAAASYVVNSATQITAVVGTGSTGAVTVTTSGGTVLTLSGFTFGSLPVITSIVPSSVSNFAKVIINGSNLTGATAVKFGGVAAVSFILVNDQQIVAVVASGSVSGNVTVTGPGGTGTLSGFTYLTPSSTITLTATPSASSAAAGSQFTVDLAMNTASGFVGWGGEVDFDASKLQCTGVTAGTWLSGYVTTNSGSMYSQTPAIDNTKGIVNNISYGGINLSSSATGLTGQGVLCTLTFTVKAGATGTTTIQPINIVLSSAAANQINNTMVNAGTVNISSTSTTTTTSSSSGSPIITSFSPTSAKNGDSVVITGTNFTGTNIVVKFGGTNASSITVNSATQITAIVGNGASGLVSVTTSQGTATKDGFNYNAPDSTSTTTTTESTLTNTTTNTSISTTTTTPTITSQQNNTQTLDFKLSDVNSSGVLSDNYSQDQTQDSTGLTVRLSINKGTKLTDATGNSVTDITVAFANLPKTESSNIIPIQAYEFGPDGSTFNPAITITVPYDPAKLGDGVSASKLRVVYYSSNNAKWEYIDCKVDAKNQLIQWQTTHFTTFAIVATSGFQFSWNMFILVVGILMILGLLLLAIIKRDNLVVAYAGLRGNQRVPVKERNEPELSTNKQAMSVYSPTQTNSEKHIKTSLTRTEEEMFNTIEIDKGNVDCNEIGLVFEDADDGSKGKGPVRIKLGYNSKLGTDNVIKINLIKRAKDDE